MSYIAIQVQNILEELFPAKPFKQIICEHYVNYDNQKLFFDYYLKKLGVFVEVQGIQHTKFVKHFHTSKDAFLKQRQRDNLKLEYVQKEGKYIVYINHYDDITKDLICDRIQQAMGSDLNCSGLTNF